MTGDKMSAIDIEARKEYRKLVSKLLKHERVVVTVDNKLDQAFMRGEAFVVSYGQKIIIETFECPAKIVSRDKKTKKKT